eukprot:UN08582
MYVSFPVIMIGQNSCGFNTRPQESGIPFEIKVYPTTRSL